MGRRPKGEAAHKYGCPLYGVAVSGDFAFMCGGGNLGIENKVVVARVAGGALSEEVAKLNVGGDAPYRLCLHPSGRALLLALASGGLAAVTITPAPAPPAAAGAAAAVERAPPALALDAAFAARAAPLAALAVKAASFSADGRRLALGGEDGDVRVLSWPSLAPLARWTASAKPLRSADFSAAHADGVVATTDDAGAARLWDAASGAPAGVLAPPPTLGPRAAFFRVKTAEDAAGVALYAALKVRHDAYVARYRQRPDGGLALDAVGAAPAARGAPFCAFDASPSGRLLAGATPEGDVVVLDAATLRVSRRARGAHMTFATAVAFTPDEAGVVSVASDASAAVTRAGGGGGGGGGAAAALLALLGLLAAVLAVLVALLRQLGAADPAALEPLPHALRRLIML